MTSHLRLVQAASLTLLAANAHAQTQPDWQALQADRAVQAYVQENTADTQRTESLWQNGQGVLFGPGRSQADACWSRTDERCLAVQIVDQGSKQPPAVEPDLAQRWAVDRQAIVEAVPDIVHTGACRPVMTTVPASTRTITCDKQLVQQAGTQRVEHCAVQVHDIVHARNRWMCEVTRKRMFDATCTVPVTVPTHTRSELTCFEGQRADEVHTCPVTVHAAMRSEEVAVCAHTHYERRTQTCEEKLVVEPVTSCKPGSVQETVVQNTADLREDNVPGADTLRVAYTCAEGDRPLLTMGTNSSNDSGVDITVYTDEPYWDRRILLKGGSARVIGTRTCSEGTCVAEVSLLVYRGQGTSAAYSGTLFARLAFEPLVKLDEIEHWSSSCQ